MEYNTEYFDKQFSDYSEEYGNSWGMNWRAYMYVRAEKVVGIVREYLKVRGKESSILEVGCATGDFTDLYLEELKSQNGSLLGGDISVKAIDICKAKYAGNKNIDFEIMELPNIKLDRKFGCILCVDVLEYFNNDAKEKCIDNLFEHLAIGGKLIVQIPLQGENEDVLLNMIKKYEFTDVEYVYGDVWYKLVESHLAGWVFILLRDKKFGKLGEIVGDTIFKILKSKRLVKKIFELNEKYFPNCKSHIIMCIYKKK